MVISFFRNHKYFPQSAFASLYLAFVLGAFSSLAFMGCSGVDHNGQFASKQLEDSLQQGIFLNEVTKKAGLANFEYDNGAYGEFFFPEIMGSGVSFIDYDQDNFQDILLVNGGSLKENEKEMVDGLTLFRNIDGVRFENVTEQVGLKDIHTYGFGFTVADYDNDGDDDFFLAALDNNMLFRNDGGWFTDVSIESGVGGGNLWSACALFIDADRDGWLDIFVGNYVKWSRRKDRSLFCSVDGRTDDYCSPDMYEGEACSFYHNNGDGTFTEEAGLRGLHNPMPTKTLGVVEIDFNDDGWPDLFMANDAVPDLLFQNQGDGTFKEVSMALGVYFGVDGSPTAGMGVAVGDVRNDGLHSIFVGNFSDKMMTVFRYTEHGVYVNDADYTGIGRQTINSLNFGLSLFDVELDGDLDLFVANGHVFLGAGTKKKNTTLMQRPHFFINNGRGEFSDIVKASPTFFKDSLLARSTAYADIDLDGDLDLIITDNTGPIYLMRNDSKRGNVLKLLLKGAHGNLNAIGAKIVVHYGDSLRQIRYVKSSDSYLSQSEFPATFGLADAQQVDSIQINWPSGKVSNFHDIKANQFIQIEEGDEEIQTIKNFGHNALAQYSVL